MARVLSVHDQPGLRGRVEAAFTLVEVVVAIGISALLAGVLWGGLRGAHQRADAARAGAELALIAQMIEEYRSLFGDVPETADTPELLYQALLGTLGPTGMTMRAPSVMGTARIALRDPGHPEDAGNCLVDPWGRPYQYIFWTRAVEGVGTMRHYALFSFGAREAADALPRREDIVPATHGENGGEIAAAALNSPIIFAGR